MNHRTLLMTMWFHHIIHGAKGNAIPPYTPQSREEELIAACVSAALLLSLTSPTILNPRFSRAPPPSQV